MSELFPTSLRLAGKPVLVVGGGSVACRKTKQFLAAGALVRVISPTIVKELSELAEAGDISWEKRFYQKGDLNGVWFAATATGNMKVDDEVFVEAEANRVFCFKGGDSNRASAWRPATIRTTDVTVAVNSNAIASPRKASQIRNLISTVLAAEPMLLPGQVALVGGGPGSADLLTAQALTLLSQADVLLIDSLAPQEARDLVGKGTEIIDVGKRAGNHPIPQEEINRLLVSKAKAGHRVVRLKGGDPYVFGRGGEELDYCQQAGVEVVLVSGVSSAIAVAARAGIPVTHRGLSRGFSVITGHEDIRSLPRLAEHTLVVLMSVAKLASLADQLLANEETLETPVAIIENGFLAGERITLTTLENLVITATTAQLATPAIAVVGEVVTRATGWQLFKNSTSQYYQQCLAGEVAASTKQLT